MIDEILRADLDASRKQRHTVRRIYHRLLDEHGMADTPYQVVRTYVADRKPKIRAKAGRGPVKVLFPQTHRPGAEAEVDSGKSRPPVAPCTPERHLIVFIAVAHAGAPSRRKRITTPGPPRPSTVIFVVGALSTIQARPSAAEQARRPPAIVTVHGRPPMIACVLMPMSGCAVIPSSRLSKVRVMSSDFAFWKAGNGEPGNIFDDLAEGRTDALQEHSDVSRFRAALLSRWPDLVDVLEPSEYDLLEAPDDAAKYVLLTLPVRMLQYVGEIFQMARDYGLRGYSGVAGEAL